jgi:GNAT superfamily N-acetyltransferase
VSDLHFEPVRPDDATLADWRHIHNLIIPTDPLSVEEVTERVQRNRLTVAYQGNVAVGCSTVRPPANETKTAVVIARILPEHRRQGFGEQLYEHALAIARELGAEVIETIILASNVDGVRFAERHGFVEIDRDLLPGHTVPFIGLRLSTDAASPDSAPPRSG